MASERLGIFGGTFDPPHIGHLVTAVNVRFELSLDRLLLVVNNVPWQKVNSRPISPAQDRLAMVEAAVAHVQGIEASRLEIDAGGVSYTANTLAALLTEELGSSRPASMSRAESAARCSRATSGTREPGLR